MKATTSTITHLPFLFFFYLSVSPCVQAEEEPVGHGYTLHSIKSDHVGRSMSADLKLIRNSSVFGADIQNLNLYAR